MKKSLLFICFMFILLGNVNVYAKDTAYSLNKYQEEELSFIMDSYNIDLEKDGNVVAGTFLKETIKEENNDYQDYQIMVLKYSKNGKLKWNFTYGKNKEDSIYDFTYSYDEEGKIDGYLLSIPKSYHVVTVKDVEKEEVEEKSPIFLKIDLEGNLVKEQSMSLTNDSVVKKVIPSYHEKTIDGYLVLSSVGTNLQQVTKYHLDLSVEWTRDFPNEKEYVNGDIIPYFKEGMIAGSLFLQTIIEENEEISNIYFLNLEGNIEKIVLENSKDYHNLKLLSSTNGYLLYGTTEQVKLKKGKESYIIIKYNDNLEEEWELIGDVAINPEKSFRLIEQKDEKYFLLYTTIKEEIEVVTIEKEGTSINKIKKISNGYYTVTGFNLKKNTLYLIGQINCPEDDNCELNKNSLFLISDEDKVIEVKEEDSTNVLLVISGIISLVIVIVIIRKRKKGSLSNSVGGH